MAFVQMAFNPAIGLRDKTVYLTQPASEAEIREGDIQGISDQLRLHQQHFPCCA